MLSQTTYGSIYQFLVEGNDYDGTLYTYDVFVHAQGYTEAWEIMHEHGHSQLDATFVKQFEKH